MVTESLSTHGASMFATAAFAELAAVLHDPAAGPTVSEASLSWSSLCTAPVLLILWVQTQLLIYHMLSDDLDGHMPLHAFQLSWELLMHSS